MKRARTLVTAACIVLAGMQAANHTANAQEQGTWRASSTTARSITGDILLSGEKLIVNFLSFTIADIRSLKPEELAATFPIESASHGTGKLFRLDIPAATKFRRKNTLCGSDDTEWMATYVSGRTLQLAFFSGSAMPVFTADVMANATNLCGTYTYTK